MQRARPLMRLAHDYDDRRIDISLWVVEEFSGEPAGLDGQALKWVSPAKLHEEDMLEGRCSIHRRIAAPVQ